MSKNSERDEEGKFAERITEQEVLKVFDAFDDPFLTASEVADELGVTRRAVNYRLNAMHEKGVLGRKSAGARAVGWWAKVAPRLDSTIAAELSGDEYDPDSAVSHEELREEFDDG